MEKGTPILMSAKGPAGAVARMASAVEQWPRESLVPYARNAKRHPADQVQRVAASIARWGFLNPILVDRETRELVAGHCRLQAAEQLGLELVPVVPLEHLTAEQRAQYRLADNRLAELGEWDMEALAGELREIATGAEFALETLGWSDAELSELLGEPAAPSRRTGSSVPDRPTGPARTQLGDTWQLGDHRLLCADATKPDDVAQALDGKLADAVVTDPPYAIYGSSSGLSSSVADDKMVRPFFEAVLRAAEVSTRLWAHVYVFCDWRSWPSWWESAKATRLEPKNLLVWDKGSFGLGSNYGNTYELVGYFAHAPRQRAMTQDRERGQRAVAKANILRYSREPSSRKEHNAQKPLDLVRELVENSTDAGQLVLDPFAGSGTTLVACELLSRRCATIEIDPANCDVAVRRWEEATGRKAKLVRAKAAARPRRKPAHKAKARK